jgi:hypothetical protein
MAKVVKRHRRKGGFTIPLAVVAGFAPMIADVATLGITQTPHVVAYNLIGYNTWDGTFKADRALKGWTPIVAGMLVHKLAGKLGVNRMLAGAGVPFVRI